MVERCFWVNLKNPLYVRYHDEEWGVPCHDEQQLYELLILECFQAGLSWECILNKREAFRKAYDHFDIDKVVAYSNADIDRLMGDKAIIRNRLKIVASIGNSLVFKTIQQEFGSFDAYIWGFSSGKTTIEDCRTVTRSPLSDAISKDLKKRGMHFVGTTTVYAYLQAIGMINAHTDTCFMHKAINSQDKTAWESLPLVRLTKEIINEYSLDGFVRTQPVTHVWRRQNDGSYVLKEHCFTDDWSPERKRAKALELIADDMMAYGIFLDRQLIAFIGLQNKLVDGRMIVDTCHVSRPFRGHGMGHRLFAKAMDVARTSGATQVYISACSSQETIGFYRAMGAEITDNPIAEMLEDEPFDLQMTVDVQ